MRGSGISAMCNSTYLPITWSFMGNGPRCPSALRTSGCGERSSEQFPRRAKRPLCRKGPSARRRVPGPLGQVAQLPPHASHLRLSGHAHSSRSVAQKERHGEATPRLGLFSSATALEIYCWYYYSYVQGPDPRRTNRRSPRRTGQSRETALKDRADSLRGTPLPRPVCDGEEAAGPPDRLATARHLRLDCSTSRQSSKCSHLRSLLRGVRQPFHPSGWRV